GGGRRGPGAWGGAAARGGVGVCRVSSPLFVRCARPRGGVGGGAASGAPASRPRPTRRTRSTRSLVALLRRSQVVCSAAVSGRKGSLRGGTIAAVLSRQLGQLGTPSASYLPTPVVNYMSADPQVASPIRV